MTAPSVTDAARLERSARFWLRAFPRRWRASHGEEALGLVLDLAAPGASALTAREVAGVVRGGLATRWRGRPPLAAWLLYRLFDVRVPARYLPWVADDVAGALYPTRRNLGLLPLLGAYGLATGYAWAAWVAVAMVAASQVLWPEQNRRQAVARHLAPHLGDRGSVAGLAWADAPRPRAEARGALRIVVGAQAALAAGGLVAAALGGVATGFRPLSGPGLGFETYAATVTDRTPAVALLVAGVVVGVALLPLVRRRLRAVLPHLPHQPHRAVLPVSLTGRLLAAVGVATGLVPAWAEANGHLVLGTSVLLAAVALALAPGTVAALAEVRRVGRTHPTVRLAVSDVWRVAWTGALPELDRPLPEVVAHHAGGPEGVPAPRVP